MRRPARVPAPRVPAAGAVLALFALLAAAGCATSTTGDPTVRGSADVLTLEDLDDAQHLSLYDAVRRKRPNWLRARGATSISGGTPPIRLYVDRAPRGTSDDMRSIAASDVQRVEFLDSREATIQFGTGHTSGAILVTIRGR